MEALNAKEKTIALLKFLGVFLTLMVLVVFGIFYDFQMPWRQMNVMKGELASYKGSAQNQKMVLTLLDSLYYQLGRYDADPNKTILNSMIGNEVAKLAAINQSDSSAYGHLVLRATSGYSDLLLTKQKLIEASQAASSASDKDQKIKELKADCDKKDLEIQNFKLQLQNYSNR